MWCQCKAFDVFKRLKWTVNRFWLQSHLNQFKCRLSIKPRKPERVDVSNHKYLLYRSFHVLKRTLFRKHHSSDIGLRRSGWKFLFSQSLWKFISRFTEIVLMYRLMRMLFSIKTTFCHRTVRQAPLYWELSLHFDEVLIYWPLSGTLCVFERLFLFCSRHPAT